MSQLLEKKRIMKELRQKFIDNGYRTGLTQPGEFEYAEISGFNKIHWEMFENDKYNNRNEDIWDIVRILGYDNKDPSKRTKIIFELQDKGFLEKECDFSAPCSKIIMEILVFLDHLEDKIFQSDDILKQLQTHFPQIDIKTIILRMRLTLDLNFQAMISGKEKFTQVLQSEIISDYGNKLLDDYYKSKAIFNHTPNKDVLIKEHQWMHNLKNSSNCKDAIIKMGSIIEYVITHWGIRNNFKIGSMDFDDDNIKFKSKLDELEKLSKTGQTGSITPTDWRITNQIIRDYRNYIHLHLYFASNIQLTEKEYYQLEPIYQKILEILS